METKLMVMEKKMNRMQQEFVERLQQRQNELLKKFNSPGYVVAGFGGDTYYCFVGKGLGFNGAALAPMSKHPKIFDTYKDAEREAYNGIYLNGRDEEIGLEVIKADAYFRRIHTMIEKNLQTFKKLL